MLNPPPKDLAKQVLVTVDIRADELLRIARRSTGEPFFGRTASNRFDDSHKQRSKRFGTCYCGFDLVTAVAETLLHDEVPIRGRFHLSAADFASRFFVRFPHAVKLTLADLTGISLKRMGGNAAISSIMPYELPQKWSRAVYRHPRQVDGILYFSRHVNDRKAVVLYDRAQKKINSATYAPLAAAPGVLQAADLLGIAFDRP